MGLKEICYTSGGVAQSWATPMLCVLNEFVGPFDGVQRSSKFSIVARDQST
jgi:hypothetical protein